MTYNFGLHMSVLSGHRLSSPLNFYDYWKCTIFSCYYLQLLSCKETNRLHSLHNITCTYTSPFHTTTLPSHTEETGPWKWYLFTALTIYVLRNHSNSFFFFFFSKYSYWLIVLAGEIFLSPWSRIFCSSYPISLNSTHTSRFPSSSTSSIHFSWSIETT